MLGERRRYSKRFGLMGKRGSMGWGGGGGLMMGKEGVG